MLSFSGKTVLVTGAAGLIGSHIVDALMAMGDVKVIALDLNEQKLKSGFSSYIDNQCFVYFAQDVSKPLCLKDMVVDYIFHAAGPMEGKIIDNYPVDVIMPNLIGTQKCLEYLRRQEASVGIRGRFVLFSSVSVYGNITDHDHTVSESDTAVTEVLESNRASYSQSKRMSEVIVQAYRKQYKIDAVIVRFSTVYGDTRFRPDTAFFEFINKAISGEDIVLNGTGFARRDNIYIDDAISAVLLVCQKGIDGQAYNISSNAELGNFAAIDEIAAVIAQVANQKYGCQADQNVKIHYKGDVNDTRQAGIILDNTKLKSLGWSLQTSLEQGINQTIASVINTKQVKDAR